MIENSYRSLAENEYLYMKASIEVARYPGENFIAVDEEAINDCIKITENVREASLKVLNEKQISTLDLPPASDIKF